LVLALAVAIPGAPRPVAAYDFEVTARTEGYGYQLRRYDGTNISFLNRRRVSQLLGLRIFNLLEDGRQAFGATGGRPPALLTIHALMRFDTDFGGYIYPRYEVPELENNQLDLMLGALEGRNLLGGWIDFTLGRQFDAELMDLFAFDGLRVRVNSPWHLFVESHVGVQIARAHPFSAAVFETDGTSGDPSSEAWSPTFGVAAGVEDLRGLGVRVAYRGTASKAEPGLVSDGDEGEESIWGVDQELVFVSMDYVVPVLGTRPLFGLRHNLLTGQLDDVQAAVIQQLGRHHLHLEYLHSRPHFDGDSIFNIFATEPFNEIAARYSVRPLEPLELSARVGYRRFWRDEAENADDWRADALSTGAGARWRTPRLFAELDLYYLGGVEGATYGGDVAGSWSILRWLGVDGRISLVRFNESGWRDGLLNFGFQLGGKLRLFRGVNVQMVLEDNISRLYRSALRLLAVLDLEFAP
jgi:hypothetical protein